MATLPLLGLALLLAAPLLTPLAPPSQGAQESAPSAKTAKARTAETTAEELWSALCAASGDAQRPPLEAFQLRADVRTRSGVQVNDLHVDYRYLAPDCIRFLLPSKNETGRYGPAQEQYWVRSRDQVVTLAGREYKEDRVKVDDMLSLARNYVALSNPTRIRLQSLERMAAPPPDLGPELAKDTRKLVWLALESPDFALVRSETARAEKPLYRVEIGLREDDLPGVAIVREVGKGGADPLLVELAQYRPIDDFVLPYTLLVHVLDRELVPVTFAAKPSQEIYVTEAALRPKLSVADFRPETAAK